jgi:ParB family transcriptional regulator, chromosome partitioning protein
VIAKIGLYSQEMKGTYARAMENITKEIKELELGLIQQPFSDLRLKKPPTWQRLLHSISSTGQQVPVIVVSDAKEQPRWILIDGYLRVKALKQCDQDMVTAEVWHCDLQRALLSLLTGLQQRPWEVIEEALLIREVMVQGGYSQQELAQKMGRDPSFIYRRLQLLSDHSEEVLALVAAGYLSPWSASRVLGPLARANSKHATTLIGHLKSHHYSTRQLQQFYQHYQKSNQVVRERMINQPDLFFKSLQEEAKQAHAKKLAKGPEGEWQQSLAIIINYLKRLEKLATVLFSARQTHPLQQPLLTSLAKCERDFLTLTQLIRNQCNDTHQNPGAHLKS